MYNKCHHPNVVLFWKQTRSLYIYIYIYTYIQSDTWDTQYYIQVSIQGVSNTRCNAINQVPCKRNSRRCVYKVLHHLGEESHNLNKLNNNTEINQVPYKRNSKCHIMVILTRISNHLEPKIIDIYINFKVSVLIDCFSDSIYGIFLIQQCNSS